MFFFETRLKEEATLKLPILKSPPDNTPTKPYTDPEPSNKYLSNTL